MAESYRAVVGLTEAACSDAEAIDRLLKPARNPYRLQTLNIGVHAPQMRALQHANFTFAKKISHTADSQDQRHRMVPGSRPLLTLADTRAPDFLTPMLIAENAQAREIYAQAMAEAWSAKNELLDRGTPREIAMNLLPNAKAIRLIETGSLLHLLHKWTMRTCFNAQEEIYQASMDEVDQLRAAVPEISRHIGPAVLFARGNRHSDLHGRLAFLRRESLERLPEHSAADMTRSGRVSPTTGWRGMRQLLLHARAFCGGFRESRFETECGRRDILLAFFLGTIFGWFPQIVAAFVLRKLSGPLKWSAAWHWVMGGAGIFLVVFLVIGIAGAQLETLTAGTRYDWPEKILFGQATLSARASVWQGLLAGAATSFVLYRSASSVRAARWNLCCARRLIEYVLEAIFMSTAMFNPFY